MNKTKTMIFGEKNVGSIVKVEGTDIENVERFTYLGSNFTFDLDGEAEVKTRLAKAFAALKALDKIWRSSAIKIHTKMQVLNTTIFSTALYGCETWVYNASIRRRILAFESKCYRKILRIKWTQKLTNEEIFERVGRTETILQKAIRRKLNLFGHIARMGEDRKLKMMVFGIVEGKNKRGRPHREWTDDIEDWCRHPLQKLFHMAQDRHGWRVMIELVLDAYEHIAHGE